MNLSHSVAGEPILMPCRSYWLNWLAMRWLLIIFQLAQAPLLLKNYFIRFYRHLTARESEAIRSAPAEYNIHVPQGMFLLAL